MFSVGTPAVRDIPFCGNANAYSHLPVQSAGPRATRSAPTHPARVGHETSGATTSWNAHPDARQPKSRHPQGHLYHRDRSRASRGAPPRWSNTTVPLAAHACTLSARGIAQRGAKVRHLWDLRWHGENQVIAAAAPKPPSVTARSVDTRSARRHIFSVTVQVYHTTAPAFISTSPS